CPDRGSDGPEYRSESRGAQLLRRHASVWRSDSFARARHDAQPFGTSRTSCRSQRVPHNAVGSVIPDVRIVSYSRRPCKSASHPRVVASRSNYANHSRMRQIVRLTFASLALAQSSSNLTGVWEWTNPQKSGNAPDNMRIKIDQQGPGFNITFRALNRGNT